MCFLPDPFFSDQSDCVMFFRQLLKVLVTIMKSKGEVLFLNMLRIHYVYILLDAS